MSLKNGPIAVYETEKLFGSDSGEPIPVLIQPTSPAPVRQIMPNPSSDPSLADLVAVLREDGSVQVLNGQLQSQADWVAGDFASTAVAGTSLECFSVAFHL